MKTGISLQELARRIEGAKDLKRDMIAATEHLTVHAQANERGAAPTLVLEMPESGTFPILPHALSQIGDRVKIPAAYMDRMVREAPDLAAVNVNGWFRKAPERRMLRTLGGDLRAFLSDRYRRVEHETIAEAVLPELFELGQQHGGLQVTSCELTERRMYIQVVFPKIEREVKRGDVVQSGLIIRNSEIGSGRYSVAQMVWRLVCLNGMISANEVGGTHVGRRQGVNDDGEGDIEHILSDEAKLADDKALVLKMRDVTRAAITNAVAFDQEVQKLRDASERKLTGDPTKAVEVLAKKVGLTDGERGSVLRHLIDGGDLSQWGVANAVTRLAHDASSYDRAVEHEAIGGRIVTLAPTDWRQIAEAA